MEKQLCLLLFLMLLFISIAFAQNENDNCPPLYTRSINKVPEIRITKVEVVDSNKYSFLPQFVLDQDSISRLIIYPEIAKRAGVQGEIVIQINLDDNGKIMKWKFIKAIGAGCDDAALDVLIKSKFYPAKILDEKSSSEIYVWIEFKLNEIVDKPHILLKQVIYEIADPEKTERLILKNSGIVELIEQSYSKNEMKKGKISVFEFTRLSDFIISQCFLNYEASYSPYSGRKFPRISIIIFLDSQQKMVSSFGEHDGDPIGFWAISILIQHISEHIKWEEVKE